MEASRDKGGVIKTRWRDGETNRCGDGVGKRLVCVMETRRIGEGTNGWCGVDELCGGDELKVYVCLLFQRQVVVGGSRGEWTLGNLALGSMELEGCRLHHKTPKSGALSNDETIVELNWQVVDRGIQLWVERGRGEIHLCRSLGSMNQGILYVCRLF